MTRKEYITIRERLRKGEAQQWTPEQAAEFLKAETAENIRVGLRKAQAAPKPLDADTLGRLLTIYGGNFGVWGLFTRIVKKCALTPQAFAEGLAWAYTTGAADRETALVLFQCIDRRDIMTPQDRAALDAMPDTLTIYRGCGDEETRGGRYGLSWTDNRAIAEFFAFRYNDQGRAVVQTTVNRSDVLAYFSTRGESELIADITAPPCNVEIVTTTPTAVFDEYMNRRRNFTNQ